MATVSATADLYEVAGCKYHNWAAIEAYDASVRNNKSTDVTKRHLIAGSYSKEETHIAKGPDLINRFDVICRFCLDEKELLVDIFGTSDFIVEMSVSLFDVKIEADDMLPKQICTSCFELLNQCLAFKQQVASADTALRRCTEQLKQLKSETQKESVEACDPGITEQHIVDGISTRNELSDGHKFEDLIDEEYTADSNFCSDYDKTPDGDGHDAKDYSPEVKKEPTSNPSNVLESSPNRQRKSRTSVKCKHCNEEFTCNSILQRHIQLHAMEMLSYQCSVCSKSFSRQTCLKGHMSSHDSPNEVAKEQTSAFMCANCNASFAVVRDLHIHGSMHPEADKIRRCQRRTDVPNRVFDATFYSPREEAQPTCEKCGEIYSGSHSLSKPRECTNCNKGFIDSRMHANTKNHPCTECKRSFTHRCKLSDHMRVHTGEKPFVCNICYKTFRLKSRLVEHLRVHSGEKPYKCSYCSKSFSQRSYLATHVRLHTGENPYKCPNCSKSYRWPSTLADHVRTHTGEKPYKCSHCSKSFGKPATLAGHVRTHTGEKPYKCSQCSKSFGLHATLAAHVRTHTDEKPYKCSQCSKSFRSSSTLTTHLRTHTGEKPYKCFHCSKSFGRSSTLAKHVRTHTNEKPDKCP